MNALFLLLFVLFLIAIHIFRNKPHSLNYNEGIIIVLAMNIQLILFNLSNYIISLIVYFHIRYWDIYLGQFQNTTLPLVLVINLILVFILVSIVNILDRQIMQIQNDILRYQLGKRIFISLFILLLIFMTILIISDIQKVTPLIKMSMILSFTFMTMFTYLQTIIAIQSYTMRKEAVEATERIKELDDYLTGSQQQYEELRKFKHDFQNILLSLGQVVDGQSSEEIKRYYHELMNQQSNFKIVQTSKLRELQSIKSKPLQSLLTQKFFIAKSKGINIHFELNDSDYEIKENDLSIIRIVGILIDNAIEYVQTIDKKDFTCAFMKSSETIEITIANQLADAININQIFKTGYSTKSDHQGYGLANVSNITDNSSNLFMDTKIVNNYIMMTLIVLQNQEV
ncbi:hypothetical protein BTM29_05985 [Companilactobacillus allii]|uniref:Sensor histidine kinase NatK-like C-terminal domain-containing protein n=1 Tax=Companilactobacillus allii TaxID=1847728 RepID=A0A1P8Q2S0_9LACO|nr:GHKL domain-containing protein [Companilactobacillus allii]APX72135.1 hypothetical protein BTM29_05985 [Companilactobacillus allii]